MALPEIRDASSDDVVRLEAWVDDSLVGHATARPVRLFERERFCDVQVDPGRRREGIGSALYAALDRAVPADAAPLDEATGLTAADVEFAVRSEGAMTADDVLDRRTRIGLVDTDRERCLPVVEALVARALAGLG